MGRAGANSVRAISRGSHAAPAPYVPDDVIDVSGTFSISVFFATPGFAAPPHSPDRRRLLPFHRAALRSGRGLRGRASADLGGAVTAASGWFTSWAMETVSSPKVVTRVTCDSVCALRSLFGVIGADRRSNIGAGASITREIAACVKMACRLTGHTGVHSRLRCYTRNREMVGAHRASPGAVAIFLVRIRNRLRYPSDHFGHA
jgi:hypothetical protein